MNSQIATKQILEDLREGGLLHEDTTDLEVMLLITPKLDLLVEAQFEAGKKQAFEELRHLIGAATTPGRE